MTTKSPTEAHDGYPPELKRLIAQGLFNLTPWHILRSDAAEARRRGLRERYATEYIPFATRQDSDDIACLDPSRPGCVVIVHDFASEGWESRQTYNSFWDWFRAAIEDMIELE